MTKKSETNIDNIEMLPLHEFTQKAYLDYANYVISDRALPSIGDGLKPVQRRIIYAMSELGLRITSKYKKSARTIGDVLGKFHPHGDTACYESMVLMAQPFSYRYPIIDGQGNWGAPENPKSFAAMRYTESRLSRYANILLLETDMGTVNWIPNFDGTLTEPTELPARLPNILLNGSTGIAVGMATNIPPHNMNEIVRACINLIDTSETDRENIWKYIHGPDFPTGAEIITPKKEIVEIYNKGKGSIRVRSTYQTEQNSIVITELPYQVSPSKIIEQIIEQINNNKLPAGLMIRDEADHQNPVRLVIIPPKNTENIKNLMSHFFATTDLEKTFRINMNVIDINGDPGIKSLSELLKEWILFRRQTLEKRLKYKLEQIENRLVILEGFLISYLNIDEIIHIIRFEDNPKKILKKKFKLTDSQTESILELKLRSLAQLEEIKIKTDQYKLTKEKHNLDKILNSETELRKLLKRELRSDSKKHGDKRRSKIIHRRKAQISSEADLISPTLVTVILSKNSWARITKGHKINNENLIYKPGDQYLDADMGFSNEKAIFLNSSGRAYALYPHTLPSIRSYGEPLSSRFETEPGTTFNSVSLYGSKTQLFISSSTGYGFVTKKEMNFNTLLKGKSLLILDKNSEAMPIIKVKDIKTDLLAIFTNHGRLLICPLYKISALTRGKGDKIIQINLQNEFVKILKLVSANERIKVFTNKQHFRINLKKMGEYIGKKGTIGKELPRGFQNVTRVEVS